MSQVNLVPFRRPMAARDPGEEGRVATSLELLFDLVFVTAVASAGAQLHHGVVEGDWGVLGGYLMAFFAIWWAWMNYTWFASAYDNGDVTFRLLTLVIMAGALVLAAGIPGMFEGRTGIVVIGYAVMRLAMAALWVRAARDDPGRRAIALTYAVGIVLVQVLWVLRLLVDDGRLLVPTFVALVVAELAVPMVAERRQHTPFHPEHGAERAGAMTIIVLGEVVLATVVATQTVVAGGFGGSGVTVELIELVVGAFLAVTAIWWLYFRREHADLLERPRGVWAFGYLHYLVYASIAALGAGLTAGAEVTTHEAHVSAQAVEWLVAGALSVFLLTLCGLHRIGGDAAGRTLLPGVVVSALLVAIAALGARVGTSVLLMGLVLAALVVVHQVRDRLADPT